MPDDPTRATDRPHALWVSLLAASLLCFAAAVFLSLGTIRFVIAGFQHDNPLAVIALVYLVPAVAYALAGHLLRTRRRAGAWLAILTATLWSVPVWAYDSAPGFLWFGSTWIFLPTNFVIILLVVVGWRALQPLNAQRGA